MDLVISLGVLHHTPDVAAALRRCVSLAGDDPQLYLGLYHAPAREVMTISFADLRPGEYLYVRVAQQDGGLAWASPIFLRE